MAAASSEGCSQGRALSQSVSGAQAVSSGSDSTLSAAGKRPAAALANPAAGSKRARAAAQGTAAGGKGALAAGQGSLKSFFGAPAASQATEPQAVQQLDETQQQQQQEQSGTSAAPAAATARDTAPGGAQQVGLQSGSQGMPAQVAPAVHQQQQQPQPAAVDEEVQRALQAHEQETRAAWQRIANRMEAPKCRGHGEACVLRTVKKSGHPNQGGQFWACARPAGPKPVGQCRTWISVSKPPKFKSGGGS